ncbi:MAG: LysR family transcriptional regulator [Deltaproteobacteria bacterium]|nr:LysR family transcriptional regulator [Deltaproteobacteria bacterium]
MDDVQELDWDHLRVFLAVMRSESLRQAGERLKVSHPTIRRRLAALEEELGLHLFDRRNDGLHSSPEAVELLERAEEVERSIHAFGRRAMDVDREFKGSVRVSAPDILLSDLLMPDLVAFSERWPQIDLQMEASFDLVDLSSRQADVAIRALPCGKTPQENIAGRKAATMSSAIYGCDHQWIGWWGEERDREWVQDTPYPDLPIRGCMPNLYAQRAACEAGMGLVRLGCFSADNRLQRRTKPIPSYDIWVLVHPDLRRSPRLRAFRDEMVAAFKRHQPRLAGLPGLEVHPSGGV